MLSVLLVLFCAAAGSQDAGAGVDPEIAGWRATLRLIAAQPTPIGGGRIVLLDTTERGWHSPNLEEIVALFSRQGVAVSRDLVERFAEVNKSDVTLKRAFKSSKELTLISTSKLKAVLQTQPRRGSRDPYGYWQPFYDKYPNARGLTVLSRVGIVGDRALVFLSYGCGGTCMKGSFVLLRRSEDAWSVEKEVVVTRS